MMLKACSFFQWCFLMIFWNDRVAFTFNVLMIPCEMMTKQTATHKKLNSHYSLCHSMKTHSLHTIPPPLLRDYKSTYSTSSTAPTTISTSTWSFHSPCPFLDPHSFSYQISQWCSFFTIFILTRLSSFLIVTIFLLIFWFLRLFRLVSFVTLILVFLPMYFKVPILI